MIIESLYNPSITEWKIPLFGPEWKTHLGFFSAPKTLSSAIHYNKIWFSVPQRKIKFAMGAYNHSKAIASLYFCLLLTPAGIMLNKYVACCIVTISWCTIMRPNPQRKSTWDLLISRPYRRQLSDNWSTQYIVSVRYWLTHYDLYGVSFWGLDLQIWIGRPFPFISC